MPGAAVKEKDGSGGGVPRVAVPFGFTALPAVSIFPS
jgi:hypothetical protein